MALVGHRHVGAEREGGDSIWAMGLQWATGGVEEGMHDLQTLP